MAAPTLELKTLTSTATEQDLAPIFALQQIVFDEPGDRPGIRPGSTLPEWQVKLSTPNAAITYAFQPQTSPDPLGFFFAYHMLQPEIGHDTYHISVAAVSPSSRGIGIFPLLMEDTRKRAREAGYEWLSICTVPKRFVKMYRILQQHGWEFVAWRDNGEKVLMKIKI